jgi:hypothetical protein
MLKAFDGWHHYRQTDLRFSWQQAVYPRFYISERATAITRRVM